MTTEAEVMAFAGHVCYKSKFALTALADHLAEWNGDFFPYLLMYGLAQAIRSAETLGPDHLEFLSILDSELRGGTDGSCSLVNTGFIEKLSPPTKEVFEKIERFPNLVRSYKETFGEP